MKTTESFAITMMLFCPYCKDMIKNPNQNLRYGQGLHEYDISDKVPVIIKCDKCGKESKTPKVCKERIISK